jgi:hypothetical protein
MVVFVLFNPGFGNLFVNGNNGRPVIRPRDAGFFFPMLLFMGSLSGVPQLVLPLALYLMLGSHVNAEHIMGSSFVKYATFFLISLLMFWDFLPSWSEPVMAPYHEESTSPRQPHVYHHEEFHEEGIIISALSEMSLVFLISVTLAVLSHWEEIHSYIIRSLPQTWSRRFRSTTRWLGIHPTSSSPGLQPATPEAIASLESVVIGADNREDCSICLEAFKVGDQAKKLSCKHLFHVSCLLPWLEQRSSCPVCRSSVEDPSGNAPDATNAHTNGDNVQHAHDDNPGNHNVHAVWNALRSVIDPVAIFNPQIRVEDRAALMQLPIRELRERAHARNIPLHGVREKSEIIELLLGTRAS